ncbi:hypothetical protein Tco_1084195, partial [Tanacetum coccineum]
IDIGIGLASAYTSALQIAYVFGHWHRHRLTHCRCVRLPSYMCALQIADVFGSGYTFALQIANVFGSGYMSALQIADLHLFVCTCSDASD